MSQDRKRTTGMLRAPYAWVNITDRFPECGVAVTCAVHQRDPADGPPLLRTCALNVVDGVVLFVDEHETPQGTPIHWGISAVSAWAPIEFVPLGVFRGNS